MPFSLDTDGVAHLRSPCFSSQVASSVFEMTHKVHKLDGVHTSSAEKPAELVKRHVDRMIINRIMSTLVPTLGSIDELEAENDVGPWRPLSYSEALTRMRADRIAAPPAAQLLAGGFIANPDLPFLFGAEWFSSVRLRRSDGQRIVVDKLLSSGCPVRLCEEAGGDRSYGAAPSGADGGEMPGCAKTLALHQLVAVLRRPPTEGAEGQVPRLFALVRAYEAWVGPSVYSVYSRRRISDVYSIVPVDRIYCMVHWIPFLDQAPGLHLAPFANPPARGPFTPAEIAAWQADARACGASSDDLLWAAALRL